MTTGDKGKLFILFVPLFTLSLLSKIVCSLWSDPVCLAGVKWGRREETVVYQEVFLAFSSAPTNLVPTVSHLIAPWGERGETSPSRVGKMRDPGNEVVP